MVTWCDLLGGWLGHGLKYRLVMNLSEPSLPALCPIIRR